MTEAIIPAVVACLVIPLAASLWLLIPGPERRHARVATLATAGFALSVVSTIGLWAGQGLRPLELGFGDLYARDDYHFPLYLYLDRDGVVFLGMTALLSTIIVKYCRYYLHREPGYRRFFATIFAFIFGIALIAVAGTLDLLFAGWEVVGVASFLLIGFYRERLAPTRNAFRAYTVYRVCDVGLLLGAWLGHLVWHDTQRFSVLSALEPQTLTAIGSTALVGMSSLLLLAASGKSAQWPFCFWLPRAMEGPTPSSAIFYGALSVHAGVFLLLRTFPIWHALVATRVLVGTVGLSTAVVATASGRVQSNVKGQIGYASVAQVGVMLVELALGLPGLALFHMVGNACLRCYQLLVSPSVVAHLLRVQSASAGELKVSDYSFERKLPDRWRNALYVFAFNEGYLETLVRALLWTPLQRIGRLVHRIDRPAVRAVSVLASMGLFAVLARHPFERREAVEIAFALGMLGASLSALAERDSARRMWNAVAFGQWLAVGAVIATGTGGIVDGAMYLAGLVPAWLVGIVALRRLVPAPVPKMLTYYAGLAEQKTFASGLFFFAVLAMAGFPVSPAFVGQDLLLHHAAGKDLWLAAVLTITFVVNGLAMMRTYTRLCLGPREWAEAREATGNFEDRRVA